MFAFKPYSIKVQKIDIVANCYSVKEGLTEVKKEITISMPEAERLITSFLDTIFDPE